MRGADIVKRKEEEKVIHITWFGDIECGISNLLSPYLIGHLIPYVEFLVLFVPFDLKTHIYLGLLGLHE